MIDLMNASVESGSMMSGRFKTIVSLIASLMFYNGSENDGGWFVTIVTLTIDVKFNFIQSFCILPFIEFT